MTKPLKSNLSNMTCRLGLVTWQGDFCPVREAAPTFNQVCPVHKTPTLLKEALICPEDDTHGPYRKREEVLKAKKVGDKLVFVSDEEVKEARESVLEEKVCDVRIFPRDQVELRTVVVGNPSVFRPVAGSGGTVRLIADIIKERSDLAFVGALKNRGDKFVLFTVGFDDQLLVRELLWMDEVKEIPEGMFDFDVKPGLAEQAMRLVDALVEEFDPAEWHSPTRERIAALEEAAVNRRGNLKIVPKARAEQDSVEKALEASLAGLKPKTARKAPAKKKAPAKRTRKAS